MTEDTLTARNRINQRNFRARRQNYIRDLEERIRKYEHEGIQATIEIQAAARQVTEQNQKLRTLLVSQFGVSEHDIEVYLGSCNMSSAAQANLFTLPPGAVKSFLDSTSTAVTTPCSKNRPLMASSPQSYSQFNHKPPPSHILSPALSLASLHQTSENSRAGIASSDQYPNKRARRDTVKDLQIPSSAPDQSVLSQSSPNHIHHHPHSSLPDTPATNSSIDGSHMFPSPQAQVQFYQQQHQPQQQPSLEQELDADTLSESSAPQTPAEHSQCNSFNSASTETAVKQPYAHSWPSSVNLGSRSQTSHVPPLKQDASSIASSISISTYTTPPTIPTSAPSSISIDNSNNIAPRENNGLSISRSQQPSNESSSANSLTTKSLNGATVTTTTATNNTIQPACQTSSSSTINPIPSNHLTPSTSLSSSSSSNNPPKIKPKGIKSLQGAETTCEEAAQIIASMRSTTLLHGLHNPHHESDDITITTRPEHILLELGCQSSASCSSSSDPSKIIGLRRLSGSETDDLDANTNINVTTAVIDGKNCKVSNMQIFRLMERN